MTSSSIFSELSIIYVEDEIIVAIEIAEQLRELGFKDVRTAHTLRAAEDLVKAQMPDIALLDVNLGNGERSTDLGVMLREKGVIVIFASGYNKSELSDRLQAFEFLEKPIGAREIGLALKKSVDGKGHKKMAGQDGPPV